MPRRAKMRPCEAGAGERSAPNEAEASCRDERRCDHVNSLAYDRRVTRVTYFGPRGTFTEEALLSQPDLAACERVAQGSVPEVIAAVERNEFAAGVVPIENMIEGS